MGRRLGMRGCRLTVAVSVAVAVCVRVGSDREESVCVAIPRTSEARRTRRVGLRSAERSGVAPKQKGLPQRTPQTPSVRSAASTSEPVCRDNG